MSWHGRNSTAIPSSCLTTERDGAIEDKKPPSNGPQKPGRTTIPTAPSWKTADKFQVTEVAGKGLGLVALVNIPPGTRILSERPLFLQQNMADDELVPAICQRVRKLSRENQREFLSLANTLPHSHPLVGTFRSNMLECRPLSGLFGVYATAGRINHSCRPNVHHSWDDEKMRQVFCVLQPIRAGDEITITYGRGGITSDQRVYLSGSRGFACRCERCLLPPAELAETDDRRILIQRLDDSLGDLYCSRFTPHESLRLVRTLLREFAVEYGGYAAVYAARLYYNAFQVTIAHGDILRATAFLQLSHEKTVLCHGYDHPNSAKLRTLAQVPQMSVGFLLCSRRWLRVGEKPPANMDSPEYTNWLFRRQPAYSVAELAELYPRDCGVVL
ncbi:set domain containing protein [Grosmannia clavigera kw1407]|uniref:Set domain containing protein n=1 Tax=Grosmannia clavigera (strain kw1407 / UAMH 11150) TaxID=655863 RepID=F0XBB1_GROCL|nr:set domain containing protein [Grosmannia clavigera kw1407]EFX05031.1 set domain containing protein [Grosmannia clavigera kw1407]